MFLLCFFLVGCAPTFSPSNRVQKIINAKLYYIPYGVTYFQGGESLKKGFDDYPCGYDEIFWIESNKYNEMMSKYKHYNHEFVNLMFDKNFAGCVKASSYSELAYLARSNAIEYPNLQFYGNTPYFFPYSFVVTEYLNYDNDIIGCNKNSVFWIEKGSYDILQIIMSQLLDYDKEVAYSMLDDFLTNIAGYGLVGCSQPLGQQEFQYYIEQQKMYQNRAIAAQQMQMLQIFQQADYYSKSLNLQSQMVNLQRESNRLQNQPLDVNVYHYY